MAIRARRRIVVVVIDACGVALWLSNLGAGQLRGGRDLCRMLRHLGYGLILIGGGGCPESESAHTKAGGDTRGGWWKGGGGGRGGSVGRRRNCPGSEAPPQSIGYDGLTRTVAAHGRELHCAIGKILGVSGRRSNGKGVQFMAAAATGN